ncbi:MAG TPA: hypothetical protein VG649_24155, partial [Candidatus Angelobacter sp.]|nr:hypothetical protein [Candidatus Angelobacter sp.]
THRSSHPSRKRHRHLTRHQYQPMSLDPEVLAPDPPPYASCRAPHSSRSSRMAGWNPWDESDIDWEWEGIARRGNRKPSLDDYDRWSLQAGSLAADKTGRNHF